jgi:hypothetical protein
LLRIASTSASVGESGSAAGDRLPNFMRQAISIKRAFVAVRLPPPMKRSRRGVNPALLPRPTRTTGMPLCTARSINRCRDH